jgi:two-component system, OmpR family, sensor histidine kinase ChvG
MVPDTDSLLGDETNEPLPWFGRLSLTWRILAINIFAVLLLAGSFFYLDSFRVRLIDERLAQSRIEADIIASAVSAASQNNRDALVRAVAKETSARLRLISGDGQLLFDSWKDGLSEFRLNDPATEPLQRDVARWLDDVIDTIVDAEGVSDFKGFVRPTAIGDKLSLAADRTHVFTSVRRLADASNAMLIMDRNARDIRKLVRAERSRLGNVIAFATVLSILLSLFLARTIAQPLRTLARAADLVKSGRARDVVIPRLPGRNDEVGQLARALSDMNSALQDKIDATEAFAADVAHEIKNPLASLGSAAQSLKRVKNPKQRDQLLSIIDEDVQRLDRMITDIADLSRIDGQLARTRFEPIDMGKLIESIIATRGSRTESLRNPIAFARPKTGSTRILGDASRLVRVLDNLIDNAESFAPADTVIRIAASLSGRLVVISVEDDGPGIPESARDRIFDRFHSDRPAADDFGKHSGLGLSIARTIIEGHGGVIIAKSPGKRQHGARLVISLPALK